jgi:hypothetical protein
MIGPRDGGAPPPSPDKLVEMPARAAAGCWEGGSGSAVVGHGGGATPTGGGGTTAATPPPLPPPPTTPGKGGRGIAAAGAAHTPTLVADGDSRLDRAR